MENSEHPQYERNIEQDRQTFLEAISNVSIEEIPTVFDPLVVQNIIQNLEKNKLFMLGEMHGVIENCNVIYTLFKKFNFRQLALEWRPNLKQVVETFIESGELDFNLLQDSPDGRITPEHFALIKKLKTENLLERLVCFDAGSTSKGWNARDVAMADTLLPNCSDVLTLAVAGKLHTATEPILFEGETEGQHPMGENIKKTLPDIASGKIEYRKGQYYNYGIQDFEKTSVEDEGTSARFYQDQNGYYIFEIPEAHAATVPNPHEKL